MSVDAATLNKIFELGKSVWSTDDLIHELHMVKESLDEAHERIEEWEDADDYIDNPDELTNHVECLRSDLHDSEERVEELEESAQLLEEKVEELKEANENFMIVAVAEHKRAEELQKENEKLDGKVQEGCGIMGGVQTSMEEMFEHINKLEKENEELKECKDITMNDLTTAEKEGDETLEEYVKMRIDKYILEGSLFTTESVQEAVPPS